MRKGIRKEIPGKDLVEMDKRGWKSQRAGSYNGLHKAVCARGQGAVQSPPTRVREPGRKRPVTAQVRSRGQQGSRGQADKVIGHRSRPCH